MSDNPTSEFRKVRGNDINPASIGARDPPESIESESVSTESLVTGEDPFANVKWHGAEGDGSADDTDAFLGAIDAADGGIVWVPKGTFMVDPIEITVPETTISGGGTIKLNPQNLDETGHHGVLEWGVDDVTISNVKIDGNESAHTGERNANHEGLDPDGSTNTHIQNVTVVDCIADGIDLDGTHDSVIERCFVENVGGYGIHISLSSTNNEIKNNTVVNAGFEFDRGGIDQWSSAENNAYEGNVVKDSRVGYNFQGENAEATNNRAIGCDENALRTAGSGHTIKNFHAIDCAKVTGNVLTIQGSNQHISANILGGSGNGILSTSDDTVFDGCQIDGVGGIGCFMTSSEGQKFTEGVVENCGSQGIQSGGSGYAVSVFNCTSKNNTGDDIQLDGDDGYAKNNHISDTDVNNNGTGNTVSDNTTLS